MSGSEERGSTTTSEPARLPVEYVLPLRWRDDADLDELTAYLRELCRWVDVTVVDGSAEPVFSRHRSRWQGLVRHVRPEPWPGRNGKVAGVVTGVRAARHELVVTADDDVRYDRPGLVAVADLLAGADLVRPQNFFDPRPWHARWDTGRSLLNRAWGADYPGTYGIRRSTFLSIGGYDGDVLFENLELSRTVRAAGGRELVAGSVFVARRPPSTRHFLSQRVRQAYDDLAQPGRLLTEAAVAPTVVALLSGLRSDRPVTRTRARWALGALPVVVVGMAELGRRRAGARSVFPATASLWAPAWLVERAVCIWVALGYRVAGGVPYAGQRLPTAAHRVTVLRRRLAGSASPLRPGPPPS